MSSIYQSDAVIGDKYRITGILGRGGVAITYSAIALATNFPVAIKVISLKQLDDWKQVELFEREAEVLKQLDSPAIPKYLDYFDLETDKDKLFCLVQEIAPGKSLFELVDSGWRATEKEVKNIARQVLEILSYLHSLDPPVIHRDIKPNNLIRDDEGKIYLVDFGAVKNTYYNTLMQGSTVVGTYGYMSPEQFRGQALPATDLYSLGATLLYLLTHRSPAELPQDTLKLDFRSAVNIDDSFTDWLEKILEPDLEARFSSADIALVELFNSENKKRKKYITSSIIGILLLMLYATIQTNKWFILSYLGFYPDNICNLKAWDNFFEEKGSINFINIKNIRKDISTLSCGLENALVRRQIDTADYLFKHGADISSLDRSVFNLTNAVKESDLELASFFIKNSEDIHTINKKGQNLLFITSDKEIAELLILNGIDMNKTDNYGATPLLLAISNENKDVIDVLLRYGFDINYQSESGQTHLFVAISKQKKEIVKFLIDRGADIHIQDNYGRTALHMATMYGMNKDIIELLINNGANVNAINKKGKTPIYRVIYRNRKDLVEFLVNNGANINFKDRSGRTPLSEAVVNLDSEIAIYLINNGATTDYLNYDFIYEKYFMSDKKYRLVRKFLNRDEFKKHIKNENH